MSPYTINRLPENSFGTATCNTSIAVYNNSPSGQHQRIDSSYIHVGAGYLDESSLQLTALHSALEAYKQMFLQIVGHIEHRVPLQAIKAQPNALSANAIQIAEETMPHSLNIDEIVNWNRFVTTEVFTLKRHCTLELQSRSFIRTQNYTSGVQVLPCTFSITSKDAAELLPMAIKNSTTVMQYATAALQ